MTSFEFLLADQNQPFQVAIVVILLIAAVEILGLLMGHGVSDLIDHLLPDMDVDVDLDVDADGIEAAESNIFVQGFSWLNVGRVPFLMLLVSFLSIFAAVGLGLQWFANSVFGLLPAFVAGPIAGAVALPGTRTASRLIARAVPREETYAVSAEQFVGLVATVTLGPVGRNNPGRARITDGHGNLHNVRVRSAKRGERHERDGRVLLVSCQSGVFDVIPAPESLAQK